MNLIILRAKDLRIREYTSDEDNPETLSISEHPMTHRRIYYNRLPFADQGGNGKQAGCQAEL